MLFVTVEVNTFLVEDRGIVDVSQFVGLDGISHNAVANLRLLAIHTEIQLLQNLLQDVRDVFECLTIVTENTVGLL